MACRSAAEAHRKDREKLARLREDDWASIPAAFAQGLGERYAAYVRGRAQ